MSTLLFAFVYLLNCLLKCICIYALRASGKIGLANWATLIKIKKLLTYLLTLTSYVWCKANTPWKPINYAVINFGLIIWQDPNMIQCVSCKTYLKVPVHMKPGTHDTVTEDIFNMSLNIIEIYLSSTDNRLWLPNLRIHTYFFFIIVYLFIYLVYFVLFSLKLTVLHSEHLSILVWCISHNISVKLFNEFVFRWSLWEDFNFININAC